MKWNIVNTWCSILLGVDLHILAYWAFAKWNQRVTGRFLYQYILNRSRHHKCCGIQYRHCYKGTLRSAVVSYKVHYRYTTDKALEIVQNIWGSELLLHKNLSTLCSACIRLWRRSIVPIIAYVGIVCMLASINRL